MKMNKLFTGLVAFVAGFALSAGSALATPGYLTGNPSMMKVVPHYEIGDGKATIIGIANLESGDANDEECYPRTRAEDVPTGEYESFTPMSATAPISTCIYDGTQEGPDAAVAPTDATNPVNTEITNHQAMANMASNADDPMNLIVTARIHDAAGMMMGSEQLCLEEHQFGYIILQYGSMMAGQGMPHRGGVVSMMDDEIPYRGYVTISAEARINECAQGYVTPDEDVGSMDDVMPAIAAWTIVQDVSENGFFGTEVPTSSITMDADGMLDCYKVVDGNDTVGDEEDSMEFDQHKCGLIPERHNNDRVFADADETVADERMNPDPANATPRAHVTARYDIGADSKVYVWLGAMPSAPLEVTVICEEGLPTALDDPSSNVPTTALPTAEIAVSMGTTIIDPSAGEVGDFTDMCMYDRGVLSFMMPDMSHAGMVWTHVSQEMSHFRMNFAGYSMANPTDCTQHAVNTLAPDDSGTSVCE